jgi:hypothetical protein
MVQLHALALDGVSIAEAGDGEYRTRKQQQAGGKRQEAVLDPHERQRQ